MEKPHQKNLRESRYAESGYYYFITTVTDKRNKLFLHQPAATIVLDALKWMNDHNSIALIATVIMPDHLHFSIRIER